MNILKKLNVTITGQGSQPVLLLHGFGCNRSVWRHLTPHLMPDYQVIQFDHAGTASNNVSFYQAEKYATLEAYAKDVVSVCATLKVENVIFIGHSVSAVIGILAHQQRPGLFKSLILLGPSPRYLNDEGYYGGFEQEDIEELLSSLERNYLGWSSETAPAIMGNADREELGNELVASFCQMNPEVAKNFARVTFLSDNRKDLSAVDIPTLIIQTKEDIIAPIEVGQYVHEHIEGSEFTLLDATGHLPHLSVPKATNAAIMDYLNRL